MIGKIAATVGMTAVLSIAGVAPAQASPGGFLQGLSEANISITNAAAALRTGYMVCGALANRYTELQVAGAVLHDIPSLTPYQAGYVVGLAERELC